MMRNKKPDNPFFMLAALNHQTKRIYKRQVSANLEIWFSSQFIGRCLTGAIFCRTDSRQLAREKQKSLFSNSWHPWKPRVWAIK